MHAVKIYILNCKKTMKNIKKIHSAFLIIALTLCHSSNSMQHIETLTKNLNRGLDFGWTFLKVSTIIGTGCAVYKGYNYFWNPANIPNAATPTAFVDAITPAVQATVRTEMSGLSAVFEQIKQNMSAKQEANQASILDQFKLMQDKQETTSQQQKTGFERLMNVFDTLQQRNEKIHEATQKQIEQLAQQNKRNHEATQTKLDNLSQKIDASNTQTANRLANVEQQLHILTKYLTSNRSMEN